MKSILYALQYALATRPRKSTHKHHAGTVCFMCRRQR